MTKKELHPWQLTETGEQIAADIRRINAEGRKRVERFTPPCPVDGLPAKYYGEIGSFKLVVSVYQCPNSHTFSWRFDLGKGGLLPTQGDTPRTDK
jgi:hypothetical protein